MDADAQDASPHPPIRGCTNFKLRQLVDQGWLVQRTGADARSRLIEITEAGQAKRRLARHHWKLAQQGLTERLGVAQVQALHALIDEGLGRLPPADEH